MTAGDFLDDALDVGPGGMVPRPDAVDHDALVGFYARRARMWDDGEPRRRPVKDAKKKTARKAERKAKREARRAGR
jgi:hypothetical protein